MEYLPDNLAMEKMEEHYRNVNKVKALINLNRNILKYMAAITALVLVGMFLVIVVDFTKSAKDRFFS